MERYESLYPQILRFASRISYLADAGPMWAVVAEYLAAIFLAEKGAVAS
jgi:hypothetical protein